MTTTVSVGYHEMLSPEYCNQMEKFKDHLEVNDGVAASIINGIFGGWLRSIFEKIKDKDSYDAQVSNLNKYGAGQETWDEYQSTSISATVGKVSTIGWLVFVPAILVIIFRLVGLHNHRVFQKPTEINRKINEIRGVVLVKQVLLGAYMLVLIIYASYINVLSSHQLQASHNTLCDIAKFSDVILYGDLDNQWANWAGTQNLTEGIAVIYKESQNIQQRYQDIFYSGKQDWKWVDDFKNKVNTAWGKMRSFINFKVPGFDDGESSLEIFSSSDPPDYNDLKIKTLAYHPEEKKGTQLYIFSQIVQKIAWKKLDLISVIKDNYPSLQNEALEFKKDLETMKENVDSLHNGAMVLRESFKNHLQEVSPWVSLHNNFANATCVIMFLMYLCQVVLIGAQNLPRYKYLSKLNFLLWLSTLLALTCIAISSRAQSSFASVNHDMCLLFKQNSTDGEELPRTFIPSNLQPLISQCVHQPDIDYRSLEKLLKIDDHFYKMFELANNSETFHHLPHYYDMQAFKDFQAQLTVLASVPERLTFFNAKTQPAEEMKIINDYTNSYQSRAASTCDAAIDHIVLDGSQCKEGYNRLKNVQIDNAKMLLGKKVCIVLTDYTANFYNKRYATDSYSCRRARANCQEFLLYKAKIQSVDQGLATVAKAISELENTMESANYALTTRGNALMADFFSSTEKYLAPANTFLQMLGCNSVSTVYESIMKHMCVISEPVSEQLMGAYVLQLYLLLILLLIFQFYVEPVGPFKSTNELRRKQTFVEEYGEETGADEEKPKESQERRHSNKIRPINESVVSEEGLIDRLDSVDEPVE